jgi:hypothetical protein
MACMKCGGSMKKGGAAKVKKLKTMQTGGGIQKIVGMPGYNANTTTMQKGGILTPDGRFKSKKTRDISLSPYGNSTNVSRTKRNGDVVTNSINTSNGYAGTSADKIKTVTDKEGNVVSNKTKSITPKAADRKINRVSNNVGRNANDTWAYQKGGATKKSLTKAQNGGMPVRILKKINPAKIKYKDMDSGFTKTPKGPYKNMDPKFTKTPNKPYKNMDPGFSITPKINPGNKDVFKNAGPPPQPKGYKQMGGLIKRKK